MPGPHAAAFAFAALTATTAQAQSSSELAKQLANPVAALISVPFQLNYDSNIGPVEDGSRWQLNFQPVVPISLNADWNVISRTILPAIQQEDIFPGAGRQLGLGDTAQSFFFSPKQPTGNGVIWGIGPVLLLPTGTDDLLGAGKGGLGSTGVALKQDGPWTYGMLFNHVWSVAGTNSRPDISTTFLQSFVSYTTADAWTFTLQTETTYDWEREQWTRGRSGGTRSDTRGLGMRVLHRNDNRQALDILDAGRHHCQLRSMAVVSALGPVWSA